MSMSRGTGQVVTYRPIRIPVRILVGCKKGICDVSGGKVSAEVIGSLLDRVFGARVVQKKGMHSALCKKLPR